MKTLFVLALVLPLAGCASSPPPQPQPQPLAADNGQPKMQAALGALQQAKVRLEAATPNKGGHREQALGLIQQAIEAVGAGMQYAAAHPTEVGVAETPAAAEPVAGTVPGAERQPYMAQSMIELREAHRQLREAKQDKGGYRNQALALIQQAMVQLREGIHVANTH